MIILILGILKIGETEHGDMTKSEVIKYMRDNNYVKITHCLFESNEYIYMKSDGNIYTEEGYLFEDFNSFYLQRLKNSLNDQNSKIKHKINWHKHFKENGGIYSFSGKHHSEESKRQMSETHKRNGYQKGEKNSQFGKRWVTNIELKESKRIQNEDKLPDGWLEGRVTNFDNFLEKYNDALTRKEKWHFIDYEKDIKENKIPRILKNKNKNKT